MSALPGTVVHYETPAPAPSLPATMSEPTRVGRIWLASGDFVKRREDCDDVLRGRGDMLDRFAEVCGFR